MMGLLDQATDDPNTAGLLSMGLRLMSTPGRFGQAFGQSGLGAMDDVQKLKMQLQERKNAQQRAELMQMELARQKADQAAQARQLQFDDAFRAQIPSPLSQRNAVAAQAGPLGSAAAAAVQPKADPMQDLMFQALQQRQIKPMDYANSLRKDTTPIKLGADESLIDPRTFRPLATNVKPEKAPDLVREYQSAGGDLVFGPNGFTKWAQDMKKAGAQNIGLKIENSLGTGIAGQVGPMLKDSAEAASAARQQLTNADNIIRAVDSGKVLSGPTATLRLKGAQIGQMLGIGGADDAEKIINTRTAIQGLAQQTLSARAQLKGQGQVSDYEGKLIASAASGNIEDLTVPEIRKLAEVNKRLSAQVVANHQQFLGKIKSHKDPAIASMADLFDLGAPQVGQGGSKTYNPVTGKIE